MPRFKNSLLSPWPSTAEARRGAPPRTGRRDPDVHAQGVTYDTIETAAARLALDAEALRARCRRGARREGTATVADLGGGIVAFKFGRSWRVQFPRA